MNSYLDYPNPVLSADRVAVISTAAAENATVVISSRHTAKTIHFFILHLIFITLPLSADTFRGRIHAAAGK